MKSINELKNFTGKRVLVRVDFNVPIEKETGSISGNEDWRIRAALPTLKFLIRGGAKVILMAHMGRPEGKVVEDLKLGSVQDKLSELLDMSIGRAPDSTGEEVEKMVSEMLEGEVLMLENLRFHKEEEENDTSFAKQLSKLGEIYVNDAFADSHRAHASIVGITEFLPSYAGFLMEKEVEVLSRSISDPTRPAIVIIGGAKIETKLPVIGYLLDKFENILIGGAIANDILKIKGLQVGKSLVSVKAIKDADKIQIFDPKVIIPLDLTVEGEIGGEKLTRVSPVAKVGENEKIYDIGPQTIELYEKIILKAKTIIWNGPLGMFENPNFERGTGGVVKAVKEAYVNGAEVVLGGGETIYALAKFAPELFNGNKHLHISTGGGAMLEFMAGKKLPGIEALKQ